MNPIKRKPITVVWGLVLAILLLSTPGFLSGQETQEPSPFKELKKGDWWLVKVEQMALWKRAARASWVDAGEWKFEIQSIENQKIIVAVTNLDRPKDAQPWELTLVYHQDGEVIDATYKVGDRTFIGESALQLIPLGKEGLSLKASIKKIKEAPRTAMGIDVQTNQQIEMAKVEIADVDGYQLWRPEETWWRYYNKKKGLPVRAELKRTSWWDKEKK